MSGWKELWARLTVCQHKGHVWGDQQWWGDSARARGGTHRCGRCYRIGVPDAALQGDAAEDDIAPTKDGER